MQNLTVERQTDGQVVAAGVPAVVESPDARVRNAIELAGKNVFNRKLKKTERQRLEALLVISQTNWENRQLQALGREHLDGCLYSIENELPNQLSFHLADALHVFAQNCCLATVRIIRDHGWQAKVFAVAGSPGQWFVIYRPRYSWLAIDLKSTNVKIPSEFLGRLSLLREQGIIPETTYVGVAFTPHKKNPPAELARQLRVMRTLQRTRQQAERDALSIIDDPVILAAFGFPRMYLAEIGRW